MTKRKPLRMSEYPQFEKSLYAWFMEQRNRQASISGDILEQKAKFFYSEITNKDDFRASDDWFENFKKRYGIHFLQLSGEKLSVNEIEVS